MGKNQAYKAMQRARVGSASGGPDEIEDGMTDGSFHSPEWHAARLASLNTSHTITWEEYKKKQKEDELKKGELEADKDRMMREYRAQLDAERASKLSLGRNHSSSKSHNKKEKKDRDRDTKKRSSRKRKHRRKSYDSSSYSSSSESSSSEDERELKRSRSKSRSKKSSESSSSDDERDSKRSRSKARSKKSKKDRRHRSRAKHSSSDSDRNGPLPLSRFFGAAKS